MSEEEIKKMQKELRLLDVKDVMSITGWGESTVRSRMEDIDFPTIKIGKKNQVSFDALKEYLQHRRITRE